MPDTILAKVEFRFQDAEGNLRNDGFHSYKYDAGNRIIFVDGAVTTYTYDAENWRREENKLNGVGVMRKASGRGRGIITLPMLALLVLILVL